VSLPHLVMWGQLLWTHVSCCATGSHYSLRSEHEKAIRYFKRAAQLDRTYLSAWTLMDLEYIELTGGQRVHGGRGS